MSRYRDLFVSESRDHLTAIEHALVRLEADAEQQDQVDALFRSVHTIKGMAGAMGYAPVAELSHAIESRLESVRAGASGMDRETLDLLFEGADALEQLVAAATEGGSALDTSALLGRLGRAGTPAAASPALRRAARAGARDVTWTYEPGTPLPGARTTLVTRRLATLGAVVDVVPPAEVMASEAFDGRVVAQLVSVEDAETIVAAVRACGFIAQVEVGALHAPDAPPAEAAWQEGQLTAPLQSYVRIEARRLDQLMNLAGELVTLRGRLHVTASRVGNSQLDAVVDDVHHLVGELQDAVLGTRLVPVWQVFDRFPRVVRDAARTVGKEATLVIEGREIELDRALLEQVADPLVHLLRNAVDHGLEDPAARLAAGKPRVGRVTLQARRERTAVVITVVDDGRGVDRARLLERARTMGWVSADEEELADRDLLRIIARPGVSTAGRVTEVSGRGVGVDAVVSRIRALGGTVEFSTVEGRGTVFELRLPLSLAIVPAIIASCGEESYALPLTHITETVQRTAGVVRRVRGRPVFVRRDRVLPLWSLRELVGAPGRDPEGSQVVIVEAAERAGAVLVDRLSGQQDLVVKSFDAVRGMSTAISGAAVLADGSTALIVDAGGLLQGQ
ncbi:MAG: chemotaxis protein CheA [Gemmatimonadetes bacterium]|nr:chemotaxis protein CheA [Gemmatimonadota bacterium]